MNKQMNAALLLTACTLLTGCGSRNQMTNAERTTEPTASAVTSHAPAQTETTPGGTYGRRTTVSQTETTAPRSTRGTRDTRETDDTRDTRSTDELPESVQSALDEAEEAVTSLLTEATREVHPLD